GVRDRPGGRDAVDVADLPEVALAEAEQDRAVDLGVAADVVVLLGIELLAGAGAGPVAGVAVAQVRPDRLGLPVLLLTGQPAASLEQQHALAGGGERPGERPSP